MRGGPRPWACPNERSGMDSRLPGENRCIRNGHSGYRSSDSALALWALQAWQRSAGKGLQIKAANESSALIRLYWAAPGDGEYGETQPLIVGGRHGAAVFIRPDMESLGSDIARRAGIDMLLRDSIVYLTCLHE